MKLQSNAIPIEGPRKVLLAQQTRETWAIITPTGITLADRLSYFEARDRIKREGWNLIAGRAGEQDI